MTDNAMPEKGSDGEALCAEFKPGNGLRGERLRHEFETAEAGLAKWHIRSTVVVPAPSAVER